MAAREDASSGWIGLPGRDQGTEAWLEELFAALSPLTGDVQIVRYRHWDEPVDPDVAGEAAKLAGRRAEGVIAKSLGTRVLLAAMKQNFLADRLVLIGVPLTVFGEEEKSALATLARSNATLFVQQTGDFLGPAAELRQLLGDETSRVVAEVPGDDHRYADVDRLAEIIGAWLDRSRGAADSG